MVFRCKSPEKWEAFKAFLESKGYLLVDLHEHTFMKDDVKYSYACVEELNDFAGVNIFVEKEHFLCLSLSDYLKVYEASLKDGYRQKKKNKYNKKCYAGLRGKINVI